MPFKTTNVGGSWNGGGTPTVFCTEAQQRFIQAAFDRMHSVAIPRLQATVGLEALATNLRSRTVDTMVIDCNQALCEAASHAANFAGGNEINYCANAFPGDRRTQADTDAVTFHELVHVAGGHELDAYALTVFVYQDNNSLVTAQGLAETHHGNSPTDIFTRESQDIGGGLRASTFLVWNPDSGALFVKVPSGSTWNGSPIWAAGTPLGVTIRRIYPR